MSQLVAMVGACACWDCLDTGNSEIICINFCGGCRGGGGGEWMADNGEELLNLCTHSVGQRSEASGPPVKRFRGVDAGEEAGGAGAAEEQERHLQHHNHHHSHHNHNHNHNRGFLLEGEPERK